MALKAVGNVVGCVWESNNSFRLSVEITAEAQNATVLTDAFASDLPGTAINAVLVTFIAAYISASWGVSYNPSVDSIRIIKGVLDQGAATIALSSKVTAFWKLVENTGTPRADSVDAHHLTEVGTVTREATSDGSFAAVFDGASYLTVASAEIQPGADFYVPIWLKPAYTGVETPIFSFWEEAGSLPIFELWEGITLGDLFFRVYNGVSNDDYPTGIVTQDDVWQCWHVWYVASTKTVSVQINLQPSQSFVLTTPIQTNAVTLYIGAGTGYVGYPVGYVGSMRRVGFSKTIPSAADRLTIFNNGQGQDWPFEAVIPPPIPSGTGFMMVTDGVLDAAAAETASISLAAFKMDSGRIAGRIDASQGPVQFLTITQVLNLLTGAADGDMIVRIGGAWTVIHKGTPGQVLTWNAGDTAPEWATP